MPSVEPKYAHVLQAVFSRPWAILPSTLGLIVDIVNFRASGGVLSDNEIEARVGAAQNGPRKGGHQSGTVAVIPVYGVIGQRQNLMSALFGGTSIDGLTANFRAALADPEVDGIVLEVDSPGGTVDGVSEMAAEIRAARGTKPIVAQVNSMAASAAYWLAAAADEVVVTPSGSVGSIGIFTAHQDLSKAAEDAGVKTTLISAGKYKAEANQWEPLSEEARVNLQEQVDAYYAMFTGDVARYRGVPVDSVRQGYGEGRVVLAKQALAQGMVDNIDTLDNTIRRVGRMALTGNNTERLAALAPGLPFSERLALASALATDIAEQARKRAGLRAEEGRDLSDATRDGLRFLAASLLETAGVPEEPEPEPVSTAWVGAARNRLALARAELGLDS